MMALVSIIIPVYNAAAWLPRCLDSIQNQTWEGLEILLIDDGSTDSSASICDRYARDDSRIVVIHKKNEGVAVARQIGIDTAHGEYVAFVDADDWIENDCIEKMVSSAEANHSDLVICDYYDERPDGIRLICQKPCSHDQKDLQSQLNNGLTGTLWNKMLRRTLFDKYHVSFPKNIHYGEDKFVLMSLLEHPLIVSYVPSALYHFDQISNPDSLTRARSKNVFRNMIQYYQLMLDTFKGRVKEETSYIMLFYSYRMLSSGFISSKDYVDAFQGRRKDILEARGRSYKRLCVYLASFKAGWPISQLFVRTIDHLSKIKSH